MPAQFPAYRKLLKRARQVALAASASELLNWDTETYLPAKAVAFREKDSEAIRRAW